MKSVRSLLVVGSVLLLPRPVGSEGLAQEIKFTRVDERVGITYPHFSFACVWGDYDNDGDLDLFITPESAARPNALYRNDGATFVDVALSSNIGDSTNPKYAAGMAWGDYDNDGDLDMLTMNLGIRLFRNDGGTFSLVSEQMGLTADNGQPLWQGSWGDYDQDGDLDFVVAGADPLGHGYIEPYKVRIFRNDGTTFTDVADALLGFQLRIESLTPSWVDYDNDGDLDLWLPVIRTSGFPSLLFRNDGATFTEVTGTLGITASAAIKTAWADYDNDGDMDLFIAGYKSADTPEDNKLYRNDGNRFVDVAPVLGLATPLTITRGISWGDYDNDGDVDLFVGSNGQNQRLFRNDGSGTNRTFTDVAPMTGIEVRTRCRTVNWVDYDNDGFLDLYLQATPKRLYHNDRNANHWIGIKPVGTTSNRDGIGARVRVVAGDLKQIRDIEGGGMGGLTQTFLWAHFGLGNATIVDSVIVRWPRGGVDVATNVPTDKYYTFKEGVGIITGVDRDHESEGIPANYALFQNYPNPVNPSTEIRFEIPVAGLVQLKLYDLLGREVATLVDEWKEAGSYKVRLDTRHFLFGALTSGVYFYRIRVNEFVNTKKAVLLR